MSYYEFKESDAWDFSRSSGIAAKQKGEELPVSYTHLLQFKGGGTDL